MDHNREPLVRRLAGHAALLALTVMLLVGWRMSQSGSLLALEPPAATAVAQSGPVGLAAPLGGTEGDGGETAVNMDDVPILDDSSLSPVLNPVTFEGKRPSHDLVTYTVERGDTPVGIAERFNIKPETLLGGNAFLSEESSLLQTGSVLTILPIDGVLHDVQPGDTLEGLAQKYGVSVEDIVAYEPNALEFPYRLYPQTQILVPGAVREVFIWTPPQLPSRASSGSYWAGQAAPVIQGTGRFIWPVGGRRITQNYWYGHQAIDVALAEGSAVYASDTGTVTYAGWSVYCFGNLIVINHGNGAETFYAHLSSVDVVPGQIVYQGNYIGATGNTGCSSGPHIHFEIRWNGVRSDPLGWLP